jgi:hypothetical protein
MFALEGDSSIGAARVIGRTALVLIQPGSAHQININRPLRRGEKFRVVVSSNVDGWLYLFQRTESGKTRQLWPRPDSTTHVGQKIYARHDYLIPDRGVFVFNPQSTSERLYVAINATKERPMLDGRPVSDADTTSAAPATSATDSASRVTNYLIKDPFGGFGRGLIYEPDPVNYAPYVYFSSAPGDPPTRAIIELELRLAH